VRDTRRTRLLLSVALLAALALMAVNYRNSSSSVVAAMRRAAGSVFGSAERAVSTVTLPIGRYFSSGPASSSVGRVTALERNLARMRAELSVAELSRADYRQLSRLLQLAGTGRYRVVAASVIAFAPGYQQTVTLDAGSLDGVRPEQTVLDGNGLVGQVTSVTATTCSVLLATDASSVVGVRLAPAGQVGWVTGTGRDPSDSGLLKLQVLDPHAVLTPGEQLVTAASVHDQPFVPGVPVGYVVSQLNRAGALTAQALVRPYANFSSLDVVGIVITPPAHNPRFSVLPPIPPKPTPKPTPSSRSTRGRKAGRAGAPSPSPTPTKRGH
jgi:rod shape-determining protein MreC